VRTGRRLGVDVGKARVGVAVSDPHGMLATPVITVQRSDDAVRQVLGYAAEHDVIELVVGLPLSLSGGETPSTADAREFATQLAASTDRVVRLVDERLSTVTAQSALHATGRNTKKSRSVIDQVAAVIILQHALDTERSGGTPPGSIVAPE
jgi:putative Holliday junction resolvase